MCIWSSKGLVMLFLFLADWYAVFIHLYLLHIKFFVCAMLLQKLNTWRRFLFLCVSSFFFLFCSIFIWHIGPKCALLDSKECCAHGSLSLCQQHICDIWLVTWESPDLLPHMQSLHSQGCQFKLQSPSWKDLPFSGWVPSPLRSSRIPVSVMHHIFAKFPHLKPIQE